jgi:phosphatidylserine synthase
LLAFGLIYAGSTAIDLLRGADSGAWIAAGVCVAAGLVVGWALVQWGRARRGREPRVVVVVAVALIAFLVLESIALWASDPVNARTNAVIVGIVIGVLALTLPETIRTAVSDRRDSRERLRTPPTMPGP